MKIPNSYEFEYAGHKVVIVDSERFHRSDIIIDGKLVAQPIRWANSDQENVVYAKQLIIDGKI